MSLLAQGRSKKDGKVSRFNKKLSQLEATYQIAGSVLISEKPDIIYQAMIESFNQPDSLQGWFDNICNVNKNKAVRYVSSVMENKGKFVNSQSILEGIEYYRNRQNE